MAHELVALTFHVEDESEQLVAAIGVPVDQCADDGMLRVSKDADQNFRPIPIIGLEGEEVATLVADDGLTFLEERTLLDDLEHGCLSSQI